MLWASRRSLVLAPFVLLAVSASSTGAQPVADFTFSPNPAAAGKPLQFTDLSTAAPTLWLWSFGDLTTSNAQNPTKTYALPGQYDVIFTAANTQGASQLKKTITVVVPPVEFVLPVVVDIQGYGARFSTEITLANRGFTASLLTMTFTSATSLGGSGNGTVTEMLEPQGQLIIPNGIEYLRNKGIPIPTGGDQGGTLRIVFNGLSSPDVAYAGARTTAPSGNGRAGLAFSAIRPEDGLAGRSFVFGLRENLADRSNLALVNLSPNDNITLRVSIVGSGGGTSPIFRNSFVLGPLQWKQVNHILAGTGLSSGYAIIDVLSGNGPYFAYGVFNDNVTNDGSYVPPVGDNAPGELQFLPVLAETSTFESELVLANPFNQPMTLQLSYVESLNPSAGAGGCAEESLQPFEQKIIPNALAYLRSKGVNIGPPGNSYAGSLLVAFTRGGSISYGYVGARVAAPSGGGQYGTFEPAVGFSQTATSEAWVYGLQQNALNRSNVAVFDAEGTGPGLILKAEIYNGDTRQLAYVSDAFTLPPGGWKQFSSILAPLNVQNGFVRFMRLSGSQSFFAYGVVNDGATPLSGATNDGSYFPSFIPSSGRPSTGSRSGFVCNSAQTPRINSISPTTGRNDLPTRVTIYGSGFQVPEQVFLTGGACGTKKLEVTIVSQITLNQIVFQAPVAAGAYACLADQTVDVQVFDQTSHNTMTCSGCFTFYSCPTATTASPSVVGTNGGTVFVSGNHFQQPVVATFVPSGGGTVPLGILSISPTSVVVQLPPYAVLVPGGGSCQPITGKINISSTGLNCDSPAQVSMTYHPELPTILSVSPTTLSQDGGGVTITVNGSGFTVGDAVNVTLLKGNSPVPGTTVRANVTAPGVLTFTAPAVPDSALDRASCTTSPPSGPLNGTQAVPTFFGMRITNVGSGCSNDLYGGVLLYNPRPSLAVCSPS